MKRRPAKEIDRLAKDYAFCFLAKYSRRDGDRLTIGIRKEFRKLIERSKK